MWKFKKIVVILSHQKSIKEWLELNIVGLRSP